MGTAAQESTPPSATRGAWKARALVVSVILLFGFLAAIFHPIGDAPDEIENLILVRHYATQRRLPVPEDKIRQSMHPPLAFAMAAAATVPLEQITNLLPAEIWWRWGLRMRIPLNQPSRYMMREHNYVMRDGPVEFRAFTLIGLRWLSVIFVAISAYFSIRVAELLLPGWPRLAAASVAFLYLTPATVIQSGAIGMEPALLMFAAWGVYELVRGMRPEHSWSLVRAGIAFGLAGLCRHSGLTLASGALIVALVRAPRVGRARAAAELAAFCILSAAPLGLWIYHNYATTGDALLNYVTVAHYPEIFRTMRMNFAGLDAWWPAIFGDFFGQRVAGVAPMESLTFLYQIVFGATLLAGIIATFRPGSANDFPPRTRLAFIILSIAGVIAIPFLLNFTYYQLNGRYLLPCLPLLPPLLATGARRLFFFSRDSFVAFLPFSIAALASGIMLFFSLGPMFHPVTGRSRGAMAYADCGGPEDPWRVQGTPVRFGPDNLFPRAWNTYVADPEKIIYTVPVTGDPVGLWVHLVIPGIAESNINFVPVDYVYLAARVLIGDRIFSDWISPPITPTRWSFPVPPHAIVNNTLTVTVERVPRLDFVLLAELRVDREPPATLDQLGPKLRISAADARDGAGERLGAPYAKSNFVRHIPLGERANSIVCQTPRVKFEPGRYLLRCNLAVIAGPEGEQAGLLIAGDGNEGVVKILPITVDSKTLTKYPSARTLEFTVPPGAPMELTCRIEASGRAAMDVDDLEVFGPLLDDRFK